MWSWESLDDCGVEECPVQEELVGAGSPAGGSGSLWGRGRESRGGTAGTEKTLTPAWLPFPNMLCFASEARRPFCSFSLYLKSPQFKAGKYLVCWSVSQLVMRTEAPGSTGLSVQRVPQARQGSPSQACGFCAAPKRCGCVPSPLL